MADSHELTFAGTRETITARTWHNPDARYTVVLVHGYGEHIGRYEHVADALVTHGAVVYGLDHMGHGKSGGDRVMIEDFEDVVTDVHTLVETARAEYPSLPTVVIGHSMGGMIAARYAQRYGVGLVALVLSGPVIGSWFVVDQLSRLDEIPDTPIDPATLSRDPAVGTAYAADPLVWHGPFKRPTVNAFLAAMDTIASGGTLGNMPTLWVHGDADEVVPLAGSRPGVEAIQGSNLTEIIVPGARHEVFNETNKDEVLADVTHFLDRVLRSN